MLDENAGLLAEACALADILGDVQLSSSVLLARQQLVSNPQRNMVTGAGIEAHNASPLLPSLMPSVCKPFYAPLVLLAKWLECIV